MNKLIFKPLNINDAKVIFDNREFIVSYFNGGISKTEFKSWTLNDEKNEVKRDTEDVKKGRQAIYSIFNDKNEYIGRCKLVHISKKDNRADVSLSIKEKFWGQGYGTQVVKFLEKLAFSKLKLNRLGYMYYSNNPRSKSLAEKLGYKYEGTIRDGKKIGNKYFDRVVHSKLKSEYKK